jgi:hypothetical protein
LVPPEAGNDHRVELTDILTRHPRLGYRVSQIKQIFGRMPSSGMLRRVAPVRTDVSDELCASIIRVTTIGELGTLAVSSQCASVAS